MSTFLFFGQYTIDALKEISAERTVEAATLIEQFGGEFISGYATLGKTDLVLIVDLPNVGQAIKTLVALTKLLSISFTTAPAVTFAEFDQLMLEI